MIQKCNGVEARLAQKPDWYIGQIGAEARLAGKPDWLVNKSKPKKLINLGNCRKTIHEEKKAG